MVWKCYNLENDLVAFPVQKTIFLCNYIHSTAQYNDTLVIIEDQFEAYCHQKKRNLPSGFVNLFYLLTYRLTFWIEIVKIETYLEETFIWSFSILRELVIYVYICCIIFRWCCKCNSVWQIC